MKAARRLFYILITAAIMFEELPDGRDSLGFIGWYVHADLKSWLPINTPLTPLQLGIFACILLWLNRARREQREYPFRTGVFTAAVLCFGAAVVLGILRGMSQPGFNQTFMYFEVRGFLMLVLVYFVTGMLLRDERDFDAVIWCVLLGCSWLALENLYRVYFVVGMDGVTDGTFDHVDSVVLAFGCVVCLGLLVFKGKRAQQRVAMVAFPLYVFSMAVMQRRAAWPVVGVGLIVLALAMYRARPKMFWRFVPVSAVLITLYLGAFWGNTSVIGQPARAIRSEFSPDPRDAASNLYRLTERADILANIATSRFLGLGFGQQFIFYYPLPNLDWWAFWHYTPHDELLWLWMDGGVATFGTYMWLSGSALFGGGQELTRRQEAWSLAEGLRTLRKKSRGRGAAARRASAKAEAKAEAAAARVSEAAKAAAAEAATTTRAGRRGRRRRAADDTAGQPLALPYGSPTVLLVAGMALVAMQITFSYVDLGLTSMRDLLLVGMALGIVGHAYVVRPRPPRRPRLRRRSRRSQAEALPTPAGAPEGIGASPAAEPALPLR